MIMKSDLMIRGPRAGTAQELRDFIAMYEALAGRDAGVASEVKIARVRLALLEAPDVTEAAPKAA
jgi:hypothetical protein